MKPISKLSVAGATLAAVLLGLTLWNFDPTATVNVQGWVLADGMPVAGANVVFIPETLTSDGKTRLKLPLPATTDSLGRYQLPAGAAPGSYRVVVKGFIDEMSSSRILSMGDEPLDEGQLSAAGMSRLNSPSQGRKIAKTRQPVPEHYSSPDHTVLRMVVPGSGVTNAEISLTVTPVASKPSESIHR